MYLYGALSSTSALTPTPKQDDLVLGLLKQIIRKQNIIQATLLQLVNNVNYLKTKENVKQKLGHSQELFFLYLIFLLRMTKICYNWSNIRKMKKKRMTRFKDYQESEDSMDKIL
ncbi:hypothetical protein FQA39_LY17030 [Lamprigera yunnana]|nr:hypothetical protein FQA39_LY17030 [Lamprigera yunnana]